MHIFLLPLSIIDLLAGISLLYPGILGKLTFYIAAILLIKGVTSFIGSFLSGFLFEIMGALDIIAGICLLFGWNVPFLWVLIIIKGLWSLFFSMV